MRRPIVWTLTVVVLGLVFYEISISHSTRPCLASPAHVCAQATK